MATRKITVKASDLNKDAPAYLEREDDTLIKMTTIYGPARYFDFEAGEWKEPSEAVTQAMAARVATSLAEMQERATNAILYGISHPEIFIEPELKYRLRPGATGICQMVDLQGMV